MNAAAPSVSASSTARREDTAPSEETPSTDLDVSIAAPVPTLFRHVAREQWGLAIVHRKLDDRVRMTFQDGRSRVFLKRFYHLFEAVDRPLDVTLGLVEALRSMSDEDGLPQQRRSTMKEESISLEEQVSYFLELFAAGFSDESYRSHHRGDGRKRPLKRHRDAVLAAAAESLSQKALGRMAADDPAALHAKLVEVLKMTDLVPLKERERFAAVDPSFHDELASTLRALLYGTSDLARRFDAYVRLLSRAMEQAPSWELATVFPAIVHPQAHVVVSAPLFSAQAGWMAPGLVCSTRPMGLLYGRLSAMALEVRAGLEAADLMPSDLMDVRDFMWTTLKPKGRARILERRRSFSSEPTRVAREDASREAA